MWTSKNRAAERTESFFCAHCAPFNEGSYRRPEQGRYLSFLNLPAYLAHSEVSSVCNDWSRYTCNGCLWGSCMDTKLCVVCGADLPLLRRADRRYCGGRCRVRAHRVRAGLSRRRPRKTAEVSEPVVVAVGAAAGISLTALHWQLTAEAAQRRNMEMEAARTEATLAATRRERDAAAEEARQALEEAARLRQQIQREQEACQHLQDEARQFQEELARQKKRIHNALVKGDEFYENWQLAQTALADARNRLAAQEAHARSSDSLRPWRERVYYLEQQVSELSEYLAASEHRRAELEGDVQYAAQLADQVRRLEKQLEDSNQKQGRLIRKLERVKENLIEQVEEKRQDRGSGSLLGKVGAALGLSVAAGVAVTKLTGRDGQKALEAPASQRLLPKPRKR